MSIKPRQMLVSASKYSIKCPYKMTPEFIVIHNTYNDASAQNEIKYMITNSNQVSFHFAIDDKEVVQGIPLNRNAWHSGDGGSGAGNRKGIAIEICYSKSGGSRFTKAEELTAKFVAQLLTQYGWDVSKVKKHQDFADKYCPHRTLDLGWDRFIKMVQSYMSTASDYPKWKAYGKDWYYYTDDKTYVKAPTGCWKAVFDGGKKYMVDASGKMVSNVTIGKDGAVYEQR